MHFSNKSMKEESFRVLAEELSYALLHASFPWELCYFISATLFVNITRIHSLNSQKSNFVNFFFETSL